MRCETALSPSSVVRSNSHVKNPRRIPPPPPTREQVEDKLADLAAGRLAPADADAWAMRWVAADDPGVEDEVTWSGLKMLAGCDMPSTDRQALYGPQDFQAWLVEYRQLCKTV